MIFNTKNGASKEDKMIFLLAFTILLFTLAACKFAKVEIIFGDATTLVTSAVEL